MALDFVLKSFPWLLLLKIIDQTDQIERTKVFLMIYRRFMRPRELLEKLIDRFEALGESLEEDAHANETRLR